MGKGPKVPQSSIDAQVNLQNTESDLLKQYSNIALPYMTSAGNYWQALMQGGPAAQRAVAPYAQDISTQAGTTARNITNTLPAGGERNLALAELPIATGTNIANLYQRMGPLAAEQLQALSLGSAGAGNAAGGVSASAGAANENLAASVANSKGNMFGSAGAGLGSLAGSVLASKGTGTGALGGKAAGSGLGG